MGNRSSSLSVHTTGNHSFMQYMQQHSNHFSGSLESGGLLKSLFKAALATAFFRCWHILIFFTAWGTAITVIDAKVRNIGIQSTLLTVLGTVLGFVISYRTTSSFERYNEGRRYWSQIILASRTLARGVWFHVPEMSPPTKEDEGRTEEERRARTIVEKKTVINLIEAFSVAVKHYLRGEEGINYVDLYHLVKFLPSYSFPEGIARGPEDQYVESSTNLRRTTSRASHRSAVVVNRDSQSDANAREEKGETKSSYDSDEKQPQFVVTPATARQSAADLPLPLPTSPSGGAPPTANGTGTGIGPHVTLELPLPASSRQHKPASGLNRLGLVRSSTSSRTAASLSSRSRSRSITSRTPTRASYGFASSEPVHLLPAAMPPKYSIFDVFPFSLLVNLLERTGRGVEGKKAARYRAKSVVTTRNVPLEISMYLTSYVSTLQARKALDPPTATMLIGTITQLVDALTGLERILTTPIPFSYSIHLWLVTIIYVMALPFQIVNFLDWLTIPGTTIVSFIFFGFLVAGEEIENPFGYDKNDLNMDHFTHNIIRNELLALTAFPPPSPADWAFDPRNNALFVGSGAMGAMMVDERSGEPLVGEEFAFAAVTPEEWVRRGAGAMRAAMAGY